MITPDAETLAASPPDRGTACRRPSTRRILIALGAALLFGASTPLAKLALSSANPLLVASLLYLGSGIGLVIVRMIRFGQTTETPLSRADLPWLGGAILAGGVVGPALLLVGLMTTSASAASLLLNLEAVASAAIAWIVFRENVDKRVDVQTIFSNGLAPKLDMSGAYAASVRTHAPHAILTFDRFHVIKLMNERLDDLRRELVREAQDDNAKQAIKGLRWLLLHQRDNLEKDAARRLKRGLALNAPLQCGYLLKEELAQLWEQRNGRNAWAPALSASATRAHYRAIYGYDPATINFAKRSAQLTQWNDYRSTKLATYVAKLRTTVSSVRPGMLLGAYTLPPDFIEVGQNAKKLAPYLDFFSPMAYYDDWGYDVSLQYTDRTTSVIGRQR